MNRFYVSDYKPRVGSPPAQFYRGFIVAGGAFMAIWSIHQAFSWRCLA